MIDLSKKTSEYKLKMVYRAWSVEPVLTWRMPSTEESVSYQTNKFRKTDNYRKYHGLAILVGIRDGDFGMPETDPAGVPVLDASGNQKMKPISSNPDSPDYRSDWKDILVSSPMGLQIVEDLAFAVFEETYVVAEPAIPFSKS